MTYIENRRQLHTMSSSYSSVARIRLSRVMIITHFIPKSGTQQSVETDLSCVHGNSGDEVSHYVVILLSRVHLACGLI